MIEAVILLQMKMRLMNAFDFSSKNYTFLRAIVYPLH